MYFTCFCRTVGLLMILGPGFTSKSISILPVRDPASIFLLCCLIRGWAWASRPSSDGAFIVVAPPSLLPSTADTFRESRVMAQLVFAFFSFRESTSSSSCAWSVAAFATGKWKLGLLSCLPSVVVWSLSDFGLCGVSRGRMAGGPSPAGIRRGRETA